MHDADATERAGYHTYLHTAFSRRFRLRRFPAAAKERRRLPRRKVTITIKNARKILPRLSRRLPRTATTTFTDIIDFMAAFALHFIYSPHDIDISRIAMPQHAAETLPGIIAFSFCWLGRAFLRHLFFIWRLRRKVQRSHII